MDHFSLTVIDSWSIACWHESFIADASGLGWSDRGKSEIAAQWLLMAVRSGYPGADARLQEFLATIGRRKFIAPLDTELARTTEGLARAKSIYRKARPGYHPMAVETIDKQLEDRNRRPS